MSLTLVFHSVFEESLQSRMCPTGDLALPDLSVATKLPINPLGNIQKGLYLHFYTLYLLGKKPSFSCQFQCSHAMRSLFGM